MFGYSVLGPQIISNMHLLDQNLILYEKLGLFNTLNAELNPICHLLALLGAHHILHVSRIRVKDEP